MRWATRAGCHFDRVACARLIRCHIDSDAPFDAPFDAPEATGLDATTRG
ncbi:MAG: chromate resistance protein ChrB domain-containing protein, partial [Acidimicrobiales bacterium]